MAQTLLPVDYRLETEGGEQKPSQKTEKRCDIIHHASFLHRRDSETVVFTPDDVLLLPDYPRAIGDSLEVGYALVHSVGLVPQATLLSISIEMSPVLAERTGANVVGIGIWVAVSEEEGGGLNTALGTAIPATVILLLFTALAAWCVS